MIDALDGSLAERPMGSRGLTGPLLDLEKILANARFDDENIRVDAARSIAQLSSVLGLQMPRQALGNNLELGTLSSCQISRLLTYIDSRLDENISIAHLSKVVRLSPAHFARTFKKTFQLPPHRYLLGRRIGHARFLLSSTVLPLLEIALACGFSDQAHLCKAFRNFTGMTPGNWRWQNKDGAKSEAVTSVRSNTKSQTIAFHG